METSKLGMWTLYMLWNRMSTEHIVILAEDNYNVWLNRGRYNTKSGKINVAYKPFTHYLLLFKNSDDYKY